MRAKRVLKQIAKKRKRRKKGNDRKPQSLVYEVFKVISHHFPTLVDELSQIPEIRINPQYKMSEVVWAGICMFLFKSGSRNMYNNLLYEGKFNENLQCFFSMKSPHMDTVNGVFEKLDCKHLEQLKKRFFKLLLQRKVFHKWRFRGFFLIAIDGTGIASYKEKHCKDCLEKEFKKSGKKIYYHNVLEAKLVCSNGFSISIATEWIGLYANKGTKQDCERKAFTRLAETLKKDYPRLQICLLCDGLYPYKGFFEICKDFKWPYIVTLKDKSLKSLWKRIKRTNRNGRIEKENLDENIIRHEYQWIENEKYLEFPLNWVQFIETLINEEGKKDILRFVFLTNMAISYSEVIEIVTAGRLRWKIEKQGFDQQKNHGYNICHKYSRTNFTAMKNHYQCCQIAHLFNQLVELSDNYKELMLKTDTIIFLKYLIFAAMMYIPLDNEKLKQIKEYRFQIQYHE